jgi:hypothetical protein
MSDDFWNSEYDRELDAHSRRAEAECARQARLAEAAERRIAKEREVAFRAGLEAAARTVEEGQETVTTRPIGGEDSRHLTPRHKHNIAGLAYADAIRAIRTPPEYAAPEDAGA